MLRLPGWLAFVIFVPLQIWLAWNLFQAWGFWWTALTLAIIGFMATRAARANWFRALLFPRSALRWEQRRHVYQGILFLVAAITFLLARAPQPWFDAGPLVAAFPWLPAFAALSLVKASVR